ncbi:hypothetical protein H4W79_000123 [Nocardiopsis terrae]|uniref:Protein kinase domain-containing protein n=1 Tax=Nocardiopsis terrae TaxID=372655 RepID=A0ABR9HA49_9ACTN|nr:serine/threonine-protein kinase [Nocardiopsis terrae]MBE1455909.1 hypothetical protein [Nocardiopsis terrae]
MPPLSSADPEHVGPHQVLSRLGEGGMGEVLLVRTPDGGLAALKVIREELAHDPGFRARFAREARTAQRVRGPFTPAVLSADTEGAVPWMATEYVPGPTLREAVREHGPFPEPSLRVLALGLANALQAIHSAGLMHRDLKPGNVLLSPRGPQVIDFGIARAVEGTVLTKTGQAFGTPAYASPEQVVGRGVGPASDVFSLAGVVVFAATGRPAFGTGKSAALLTRVVRGGPDLDGVPEALRPLLTRCLAKDPAERPNADQIARTLSEQPLPPAEHGWLPTPINQSIETHRSATREAADGAPADGPGTDRASDGTPVRGAPGVPGAPAPVTPPPGTRGRTALIVGAAALATVLMTGTLGLLTTVPLPGQGADEAVAPTEADGDGRDEAADDAPAGPSDVFGGTLTEVSFAPGGESLYVTGTDHLVEVDWRTGEELHRFDARPNSLTVAANGTIAGGFLDALVVWNPDREITHYLEDPELQDWNRPDLSDDGTRVAVSVNDAENEPLVQVWDLEKEEVGFEFATESHTRNPDLNADATLLAVSDSAGTGRSTVWDLATEEAVVEFPNDGFPAVPGGEAGTHHLKYLAFHPTDPSLLAVKTSNRDIALYDLDNGETTPFETPDTGGNDLYEIHFSADGSRLAASGAEGAATRGGRVWDTATGDLLTGEGIQLYSQVAFHPEGTVVATIPPGPGDDRLLVLDGESFEVLHEFPG